MTLDQGISFVAFAVVAAVTPGPSNVVIASTGAAFGAWRGLPCVLGVSLGMATLIAAAALGLGEVAAAAPWLPAAIRVAGSVLLLRMAWTIATAPTGPTPEGGRPVGLAGAAALQWANPKGWVVAVAAAAAYADGADRTGAALLLGGLFAAAAFPCGLAWLCLGSSLQGLMRRERPARIVNAVMGLVLAASVLTLF
jgi:threonine/homoserine/homoserine lactone efflux protein